MLKIVHNGKYINIKTIDKKKVIPGSALEFISNQGIAISISIIPANIKSIIRIKNISWKKIACSALNLTKFDFSLLVIQIIRGASMPILGINIERCERSAINFSSFDIVVSIFTSSYNYYNTDILMLISVYIQLGIIIIFIAQIEIPINSFLGPCKY
jgi:hypothetical protein